VRSDSAAGARAFVESFYRWYVPIAIGDHKEPADAIALRERPRLFSSQLYRALKADNDAQAKAPGELVGLDSDPFLNSQDPCERFAIGRVERRHDAYRVEVFAVCSGKRLDRPSALADVRSVNGHWKFVDFFHDGGKDGLLATLKLLSEDRRKSANPAGAAANPAPARYDAATMDPPVDSAHPPRMAEVAFQSAGDRLNGLLYIAGEAGPHPVVLLLHGNPGNERNLDVAQAIRRAGHTVLYFDYRGNWGSGGLFSRTHALEDVAAALRWVRSPAVARQFGIDTSRVILVGHSMGGWLALMSAAADPKVACVAALDARNVGAYGRQLQRDRAVESALIATNDSLTAPGAPYRAEGGGAALVREMQANAERWDVTGNARALGNRPVLLIAATFKADQDSLVSALGRAGAQRVTALAWPTDHSFSDRRLALARTIVDWLGSACALPASSSPS